MKTENPLLKSILAVALTLSLGAAVASEANDAKVRAALSSLAPGTKVDSIVPSPLRGFREVVVAGQVYYVSDDGRYLVNGSVLEVATKRDLTEARRGAMRKVALAAVGVEQRVIFAAASPKHTITVFTDLDCSYCQRLHSQIAEYNRRGISVEYLFFPRTGIGSPSHAKAVSVWCAPDRKAAFTRAKSGKPPVAKTCVNPVADEFALGQRIGVTGTPAIFAEDGSQIGGYLSPDQMLTKLDALKNHVVSKSNK